MKLVFLSFDKTRDFTVDDELAIPALAELGYEVETVSWHSDRDWSQFDAVLIRSTWDYQDHWDEFLKTLIKIDSQTLLLNPLEIVKWNINKLYLKELGEKGVALIPTLWPDDLKGKSVADTFELLGSDKVIFKPLVGANADGTYPITKDGDYSAIPQKVFDGSFMAQSFIGDVLSTGEYSLFYFSRELSHVVLKTPKEGDYRVQEEHGGIITSPTPSDDLIKTGDSVMKALDSDLLYARVDLVKGKDDKYLLMELELIEPALYFRMCPDSPAKFASSVHKKLTQIV